MGTLSKEYKTAENNESKAPPTYLLMLLASLASFSAVVFTPALPEMAKVFNITKGQAGSAMSFYLFGYAFGMLIYAPIGNRFGRKHALFVALILCIIATLLCIVSGHVDSYDFFLWSRFLQAFGATGGLQVALTILGDCYKPPKSVKVMSFITVSFAIGPSIGIFIGGFLTQYIGWLSCFYFLVLYIVTLFVLSIIYVKETLLEKEHSAAKIKNIIANYIITFKQPRVLLSGLMAGLTSAFPYLFATLAPFIAINLLSMSPSTYGYYNLIPPLGIVLGSVIANAASKRCVPFLTIGSGICLMIIATGCMFILFLMGRLSPLSLFFPIFLALVGLSLVLTNVMGLGMHFAKDKCLGSATINFLNLLMASISVLCVPRGIKSALLLPSMYIAVVALQVVVFIFVRKKLKKDRVAD